MASGYLETLKRHRERQEGKGNGFGYRVVNGEGILSPIANTLLATGGSGKERTSLLFQNQKYLAVSKYEHTADLCALPLLFP